MSPLSILPGRIRFELPLLIGGEELCQMVERELASVEGVIEASANRRTGRILVKFDETAVSQKMLADRIEKLPMPLTPPAAMRDATQMPAPSRARAGLGRNTNERSPHCPGDSRVESGGFSHQFVGQLLLDLLVHSFLPKPLDLLVPAAVAALRR